MHEFISHRILHCMTRLLNYTLRMLHKFLLINCVLLKIEAARILCIFPTASLSHQFAFRPLTHALAERGHEVTIITPNPAFLKNETPINLKEIDVHDISYEEWSRLSQFQTDNGKIYDEVVLKVTLEIITTAVDRCLKLPQIKELLGERFDLLLIEAWIRPAMIWSHAFKAPVIKISSFGPLFDNYDIVGGPTNPIFYSNSIQKKNYNHTMWEKIYAVYELLWINRLYQSMEGDEQRSVRKHFPDAPAFSELNGNVRILFINLHPMWEGNRPVPPTVVHTGGLHQTNKNDISKELKTYLDKSTNGVIYISFGTNFLLSELPRKLEETFNATFSELPYNVLWKRSGNVIGLPPNVRVGEWFPQSELLKHPNVKLFITQGGLQSTDEAIAAGVPLIGLPLIADQFKNVDNYVLYKIGIRLDIGALNVRDLTNAVYNIIEDSRYKENVVKLRRLLLDQPMTSLERALWWTEHVLRHGAEHLRSPAASLGLVDYYEIPLLFLVLACCFIIIPALYFILPYFISLIVTFCRRH